MKPIVYAIGDIHGHRALLDHLLDWIEADAALQGRPAKVIFLGDYVDRGPFSRQVIERLMAGPSRECDIWICLRGNHEDMMLDAMAGQASSWIRSGGRQTLDSYEDEIPSDHLDWIRNLRLYHEDGDRIFVHAGLRPGIPLVHQDPNDLTWIRGEFLDSDFDFGKLVVHGHTPCSVIDVTPFRIGIDTGAFATGCLTCIAFDDEGRDFRYAQAVQDGPKIKLAQGVSTGPGLETGRLSRAGV